MSEIGAVPTDLVRRLHAVRIERGLTIQEMAGLCGLPKSSLESYMRMEGARRPGVDALASITRGMNISADWLLGLKTDEQFKRVSTRDYGLACMAVASKFLADLRAAHERDPNSIVTTDRILGQPDGELAVSLMLDVLTALETINEKMPLAGRAALFSDLVRDADSLERLIKRPLGSR